MNLFRKNIRGGSILSKKELSDEEILKEEKKIMDSRERIIKRLSDESILNSLDTNKKFNPFIKNGENEITVFIEDCSYYSCELNPRTVLYKANDDNRIIGLLIKI